MDSDFLHNYLSKLSQLIYPIGEEIISDLIRIKNIVVEADSKNKKTIIVGNGGSLAIANHFSVDLTKNARIRCVNFNEPDLVTCFANDFGYEFWVAKAIEYYGDDGDVLIAISSSGCSSNILNGCKAARDRKFFSVITFSGFDKNNPLRKAGDINPWVDSKAYNFVENIHQIWLLAIVDLIIGNTEYSAS